MWQYITGLTKRCVFVLLMTMAVSSAYANIVFVHLGSQLPEYLYIALEQARLFNPNTDIYLIANKEAVAHASYDFTRHVFTVVACEDLERSPYHLIFEKNSPLNPSYRDGFWRKATERFFYIHEFVASRNLKQAIHLESDVMLYVDIATIKGALSLYKGVGAVFDSDHRCIPSFLYCADQGALEHFVAFIAKHAAEGSNDMEILSRYRKSFSREYIDTLPLIMPEYMQRYTLVNNLKQRPSDPSIYVNNFWYFVSIFDGAALGQYLGGMDLHIQALLMKPVCLIRHGYNLTGARIHMGVKFPLPCLKVWHIVLIICTFIQKSCRILEVKLI